MDRMDAFIHWAGFLGAWLLVAGPLFQAAIELRDEELDQEAFERVRSDVQVSPRVSRWWWLLPPVAFYKMRKRNNDFQLAALAALTLQQREQFVGFKNKATAWFTVAGGAFLIALKETWELAELYELPVWIYWVAVVVLSIVAVGNTIVRLSSSDEIIHVDDPGYQRRQRAERAQRTARKRPADDA